MPNKFTGVILDTETSGFGPGSVVIEAARMEISETPMQFIKMKPEDSVMDSKLYGLGDAVMSLGAMNTHKITPDMIEGLPVFKGYTFYGEFVVGHNVDFDVEATGYTVSKRICTLALSRLLWPELDSHAQGAVLLHIGAITKRGYSWAMDLIKNAHRAGDDVLNCARILKMIIYIMSRREGLKQYTESWEALSELSLRCQIPEVMPFGKHKGMPIADVPQSWIDWLYSQEGPKQSIYLTSAFRKAGKHLPESA